MLPTLNFVSLNVYLTNISTMFLIRQNLWTFSNYVFSVFTDKSKLIPNCFILPFEISKGSGSNWYNTKIVRFGTEDTIIEADDVPISLSLFQYRSEDKSLIAKYELTSNMFNSLLTNSYIDYPTLTSYEVYLPFFGYQPIDYKYLKMGIIVSYFLDVGTGNLICNIDVADGIRILELNTNVGNSLVISGADYGGLRDTIINSTVGLASSFVGASIPAISSSATTTVTRGGNEINQSKSIQREVNPNTNRLRQTKTNETLATTKRDDVVTTSTSNREYRNYGSEIKSSINALGDLASMRVSSNIFTSNGTNTSFNFINECFIKISRPKIIQSLYNDLKSYQGRPTRSVYRLNQCNGYVQVGMIHLNINAPFSELEEIDELLHSGVIINNPTAPEIIIENTETTVEV